ncbi:hypothetical protein [Actinomadura montaniterrae]|uniref:Uncharacterized protein n=1 Tax=Actinomadura montaniterrae TaxID=1803903 RepID=A0A6L3VQH1_9ACTN|nr:hypothetical protein [Actinomadura montaniterrae]KAB2373795.1 hypothetical protein F9B16_28250 [Actinomadura montaniterrae]
MYVIRLPDGTLRVPHSVLAGDDGPADDGPGADRERGGRIIADAYVEIGPGDPDYDRLLGQSLTEQELEDRRRRWRDEDAELARRFEEWRDGEAEE